MGGVLEIESCRDTHAYSHESTLGDMNDMNPAPISHVLASSRFSVL